MWMHDSVLCLVLVYCLVLFSVCACLAEQTCPVCPSQVKTTPGSCDTGAENPIPVTFLSYSYLAQLCECSQGLCPEIACAGSCCTTSPAVGLIVVLVHASVAWPGLFLLLLLSLALLPEPVVIALLFQLYCVGMTLMQVASSVASVPVRLPFSDSFLPSRGVSSSPTGTWTLGNWARGT
jgi:hypothetical protein